MKLKEWLINKISKQNNKKSPCIPEIETPKRKRMTWSQACLSASLSLRDAEEKRRHFAEKEAKRI